MMAQPFAVPALLFCLGGLPLVLGLIPRNRFYGVRTARTLSSDDIWYPVNRVVGSAAVVASGVYAVVAILLPYDRRTDALLGIWAIHLVALVAPLLIGLALARRDTRRH
jgi:hypothetical protein